MIDNLQTAQFLYAEWEKGRSKNELERVYLNDPKSHGKHFTALIKKYLGIDTEGRSPQSIKIDELKAENAKLRTILEENLISY